MIFLSNTTSPVKNSNKLITIKQVIISLQILLTGALLLTQFDSAFARKVTSNFEHYSTGFPLDGAHRKIRCNSCHQRAIFKGTPTACSGCHSNRSTISSSKKSINHIRTTNNCDNCHVQKSWLNARMDHNSITGSCSTCHNGTVKIASSKNSSHVQSSDRCENCHTTRRWLPARFFHSNIAGNCVSCHNKTTWQNY